MNKPQEAQLAAYIDKYNERTLGKLVLNRVFQGKVTKVNSSVTPPQVQVQRVGESSPDLNWYAAAVPNYTPQVGDTIDLAWRDDSTAHVQVPLQSAPRSSLQQVTLFSYGSPLVGSVPAGARFLKQASTLVATSDSSANINIQFPAPFPKGLLVLKLTPGDTANGLTSVVGQSSSYGRSSCSVHCYSGTTPLAGQILRINWEAIGW